MDDNLKTVCDMYLEMRNAQRAYVIKIQQSPPTLHRSIQQEMDELQGNLDSFVHSLMEKRS